MPADGGVYDIAVIGGGPAGIAAATRAGESGKRVLLLDEGVGPGGQIWRPALHGHVPTIAQRWLARFEASRAEMRHSASVFDIARGEERGFQVFADSVDGPFDVTAESIVLATGARERFLPFPGWTLPNVVGVGGAQALLKSGMSVRGKRVVIAGTGPLMLPVAASLARAGAKLLLVAEQAPAARVRRFAAGLWRKPSVLLQAATLRAAFRTTRYATGTWVTAANGDSVVREAVVTDGTGSTTLSCDLLCVAFGLIPNAQLARLLGCEVAGGSVLVDVLQTTSVPKVFCAGETTGIGGVDLSLIEGEIAGLAAADRVVPQQLIARRTALMHDAAALDAAFALRPELRTLARPDTIVCRCEDVSLGALDPRWTSRQAKLYTRAGMGPCQGRVCGAALEHLMGWTSDSVRPPIQPARLSALLAERVPESPRPVEQETR